MAGRQGFELGGRRFSKRLMALDFWVYQPDTQAVTALRYVHCRPLDSSHFTSRFGDSWETVGGQGAVEY